MTQEEKVAGLEAQVKTLESGLEAATKAHNATKAKLAETTKQLDEHKVKLKDAEKQITAQAATIADIETDLDQAGAMIEELKKAAAKGPGETAKKKILTIDATDYEFVSEFRWKGEIVTFEKLQENTKLARELISEGVGDLKPVD
ncbi:hypothetical protein [Arsenicibacter rosenii]|uniref:Uncharacterized protein n=1 Tax=Arsenicibacter rosenii TaxID=1750698 RepID=A0A1S2VEE6_9BACT|nr:hypothetical protein [Arsenicibacter rosenii]OIN56790.1 hypothetical protein BLX24_22710 [Arsenicibacter rosenii]